MALPQGLNLRGSLAYVTDAGDDYAVYVGNRDYPLTSTQGNNVGWEANPGDMLNRNSGIDVRLAGIHYRNGSAINLRIDLPATGNHNVRIAAGDASAVAATKVELFDTTSSLGVLASAGASAIASGSFRDATNTEYSAANWPGSNSPSGPHSFSTTICRFALGGTANFDILAHVYVEAAGGGGFKAAWARNNTVLGAGVVL